MGIDVILVELSEHPKTGHFLLTSVQKVVQGHGGAGAKVSKSTRKFPIILNVAFSSLGTYFIAIDLELISRAL